MLMLVVLIDLTLVHSALSRQRVDHGFVRQQAIPLVPKDFRLHCAERMHVVCRARREVVCRLWHKNVITW